MFLSLSYLEIDWIEDDAECNVKVTFPFTELSLTEKSVNKGSLL